ncbi:MAG: hypothetical protein EOP04_25380 [Proteobacteria bacterium]|nr:MAG: hypothetical protein EOP04_25380 [Pseudomonadota bacterium]
MRNLVPLIVLFFLFQTSSASSMTLQTRSHSLCGVDTYVSKTDALCGVGSYFEKSSPACAPIYNSKTDARICGFDEVLTVTKCERIPGSREPLVLVSPNPEDGCPRGYQQKTSPAPKRCQNVAFGIASYSMCRDVSHGVEYNATCALPIFGIASYKTCSFYKTPEELTAYIDATSDSLLTYKEITATEGLKSRNTIAFSEVSNKWLSFLA